MSFYDEGGEPPTATVRPGDRARRMFSGQGSGPTPDERTLLVRRAIAAGAIFVVLILIVIGIKGCLDSRKRGALTRYNSNVAKLVGTSDGQGRSFFAALSSGGGAARVVQTVSGVRDSARSLVGKAKDVNVPGPMKEAQRYLIDTLSFRSEALDKIAGLVESALSRNQTTASGAIAGIAGQMQAFTASDVIFSYRVAKDIKRGLNDNGVHGVQIAQSHFMTQPLIWLDAQKVAEKLGGAPGATPPPNRGKPAPGTHGHSLDGVTIGGQALTSSGNRVHVPATPAVAVKIANGGSNDETSVVVKATISGQGFQPITGQTVVPKTKAGQPLTVNVPLPTAPPVGKTGKLTAQVVPVPGEKNVANNTQTFPVTFTP